MMTIEQLRDELNLRISAGFGDAVVVLSKDEEGNEFKALYEISEPFVMHGKYHLEYSYDDETEEPIASPRNENEFVAIVFWP
jgi:hypothetical protein